MCVCVRERDLENECVCVCVCARVSVCEKRERVWVYVCVMVWACVVPSSILLVHRPSLKIESGDALSFQLNATIPST